jgi:hypothetical protein
MRIGIEKDNTGLECSAPFDPVGSDALDDREIVGSLFSRFRSVIWERGLELDGQTIVRVSDVDDDSAALYVQGRPEIPLIIDSDGDGVCDSVQAEAPPAGPENDPVKVQLQPVRSRGKPEPGTNASETAEPATNGVCALSSGNTPDPLCLDTTMTFVLPHSSGDVGEALYAVNPSSSGIGCSGDEWQATVDGGWACVAAAARDRSGNLGISAPIRICYDVPSGRCADAGPAPECTDGCAMPELFLRGLPNFLVRY